MKFFTAITFALLIRVCTCLVQLSPKAVECAKKILREGSAEGRIPKCEPLLFVSDFENVKIPGAKGEFKFRSLITGLTNFETAVLQTDTYGQDGVKYMGQLDYKTLETTTNLLVNFTKGNDNYAENKYAIINFKNIRVYFYLDITTDPPRINKFSYGFGKYDLRNLYIKIDFEYQLFFLLDQVLKFSNMGFNQLVTIMVSEYIGTLIPTIFEYEMPTMLKSINNGVFPGRLYDLLKKCSDL